MDTLWAPWRGAYLLSQKKDECLFCVEPKENNDEKNLIFERRKRVFGVLNKFPYNSGHLMIAPYRHVTNLNELDSEEWSDMLELMKVSVKVLGSLMHPDGYNLGINLGGAVSGAGFAHLHLHIVPRWNGDTNFMPILAETKVISQHLEETYRCIVEGFIDVKKTK
jgi:ATP adenylyltransferase